MSVARFPYFIPMSVAKFHYFISMSVARFHYFLFGPFEPNLKVRSSEIFFSCPNWTLSIFFEFRNETFKFTPKMLERSYVAKKWLNLLKGFLLSE